MNVLGQINSCFKQMLQTDQAQGGEAPSSGFLHWS